MKQTIQNRIETLKSKGYSVLVRTKGEKTVIMWSTLYHSASASFNHSDKQSFDLVLSRLDDSIFRN